MYLDIVSIYFQANREALTPCKQSPQFIDLDQAPVSMHDIDI